MMLEALLSLILLTTPVSQNDDFSFCEMPNSQRLEYGELETGVINDETPLLIFCFEGERSEKVIIRMNALDDDLDPYLFLTTPQLDQIYQINNDIDEDNQDAFIEFTVPDDGDYLIAATRFGTSEGVTQGEFEIVVEVEDGVIENFCEDAPEIEYGDLIEGRLDEDAQFYCFEGQTGDEIVIEMSADGGRLDPLLTLYDATHSKDFAENDDAGNDSLNSRIEFTLPEDGMYLIEASRFGETDGKFTLSLTRADR